jgi:hypothetical protein
MLLPGPKPRPALVIDVGRLRDDPAVEVIYGTSRKLERLYPGEFVIAPEDGDAFAASGLSFPTKFDTTRAVFLPYTDDWFSVPAGAPYGQIPTLGVLHPGLMRRAKAAFDAGRRVK